MKKLTPSNSEPAEYKTIKKYDVASAKIESDDVIITFPNMCLTKDIDALIKIASPEHPLLVDCKDSEKPNLPLKQFVYAKDELLIEITYGNRIKYEIYKSGSGELGYIDKSRNLVRPTRPTKPLSPAEPDSSDTIPE